MTQRPVTVPILFRLGRTYDFDLRDFAEDDSARLIAMLTEAFADQALEDVTMSRRDIQLLAGQHPNAAAALISLHRSYDLMRDAAHRGEQKDENVRSPRPIERVREFLETSGNYFTLRTQGLEPERFYKIMFRVETGSGVNKVINFYDNDDSFKVVR